MTLPARSAPFDALVPALGLVLILVLGLAALAGSPARAQIDHRPGWTGSLHPAQSPGGPTAGLQAPGEPRLFTETERRILRGVLDGLQRAPTERSPTRRHRDRRGSPGPGLGAGPTADGLPPGIAMNLQRGHPLPPGLARQTLPAEIRASLPPRHAHDIVLIGDDAYLIGRATGVIVDILLGR